MGSKALFETLVREHAETLRIYLRAVVRDAYLVDDLFQDSLLTAWKTFDRFDQTRPFAPWLRGIAAKLVLSNRRQSSRRQGESFIVSDPAALELINLRLQRFDERLGEPLHDKLDVLRNCLEHLPQAYKDVVEMRYRQQEAAEVCAGRLQITLDTWKKRLQRARARLMDCLRRKLAPGELPS